MDPSSDTPPSDLQIARFFSIFEAALIFNVPPEEMEAWITAGQLRAFQLGTTARTLRIRRQDLEALLKQTRAQTYGGSVPLADDEEDHNEDPAA